MIDERKKEVRKEIREKKKLYTLSQKKAKSKLIFDKLELLDEFKNSDVVLFYWSMPDEVFTHDYVLKWYKCKRILLPVVKSDELELKTFNGKENMEIGEAYGIEEPIGENFEKIEEIDLIIVPGIAFDKNNNRLGRGKAYYDKLLKQTRAMKVGVCFDFQFMETIPVDEYDIKMDLVITG